jgi:hypothetical protein
VDDSVLLFPRQTLVSQLERVLSVPGIESACFKNRESDRADDLAKFRTRIYRHQSDGELWDIRSVAGDTLRGNDDTIRLNIIVDEYLTSRTGSINSNGPILAHIANLPSQARGNMVLTLVLGITPGE